MKKKHNIITCYNFYFNSRRGRYEKNSSFSPLNISDVTFQNTKSSVVSLKVKLFYYYMREIS